MTGRHIDRYREIAETLSRHGLGYLVGVVGLERVVPFHRGLLGHEPRPEPYTQPEHVRLAFEQLGATFIKLGQILSTRPDLLAPEYQRELAKLQDAAPPVPGDVIAATIAAELGRPVDEVFASFDAEPLAAASIGQAHAATLDDGTEVVVKVRRPSVVGEVHQDLEILRNLAARASRRWSAAADYDVVGLADEFADTIRGELDYLQEARNAERFARNFTGDAEVHIPRVFWEMTTSRVLTLERIHGVNVSDLDALDKAAIDRRLLAERATRVVAQMVFEDGVFHADPHPGNFFIEPGGRIGIIDFGMVGEIDAELRQRLGGLLLALVRQDPDRITAAVVRLSATQRPPSRPLLREDLRRLVRRYAGRSVGDLPVLELMNDVMSIMRRHHLQLPRELALLVKALAMNEGLAANLDPDFRFGAVLAPYAQQLMAGELSPSVLARRLQHAGLEAAQLGIELPEQLRRLVDLLDREGPELRLRSADVEMILGRIEQMQQRVVAGLIGAAVARTVVGVLMADPRRRDAWERPLFAGGVAIAAGAGVYLAGSRRVLRGAAAGA